MVPSCFCTAPSGSVPTPPSTDDTCKLVLPCLLTEADLLHVSFLSATSSSLVVVAVAVLIVVVIVLVVLVMVFVVWMKLKRQGKQFHLCHCVSIHAIALFPGLPQLFFEFMLFILQAIKAGDEAGDEAIHATCIPLLYCVD